MLRRVLLTGLVSGAIAGAVLTLVHLALVQPLIAKAESFEAVAHNHQAGLAHAHGGGGLVHTHQGAPAKHSHANGISHAHAGGEMAHAHETSSHAHADGAAHGHDSWAPDDGLERTLFTLLSNLLLGIGYGLLLAAAWAVLGRPVSLSKGLLWGAAGFASFAFMPALGLPPELPGAVAGDLMARQSWWLLTALATAAGLGFGVFSARSTLRALGLALIALPHLIGAPHAGPGLAGSAPPELAAQFVMVSMLASAVLWVSLGGIGAYVAGRLEVSAAAHAAPKPST